MTVLLVELHFVAGCGRAMFAMVSFGVSGLILTPTKIMKVKVCDDIGCVFYSFIQKLD